MAIGDRPALAVGFVGGMIASQGKSGFLGALAAGFIAGYLILALRKACENLPEALEKIAPVLIYPVVGVLLIGLVMSFVVEPVMGAINMALNDGLSSMGGSSKLILGFVLAAMMAIDMGGPFNKAAYVLVRRQSLRQLRCDGSCYDWRYDTAVCDCAGNNAV